MKKGENLKRKKLPTMKQLQYLIELYTGGVTKATVDRVAKACGVSHSSVSRYFKLCQQNGLLTEKYELTSLGKIRVEGYIKIRKGLEEYFRSMDIPPKEVEENVKNQIENVEFHVLMSMIKSMAKRTRKDDARKVERFQNNFPMEIFQKGKWKINFLILHLQQEEGTYISMADRGFQKPGILHLSEKEGWIELTTCEMFACSRVNGEKMRGHLESLKYVKEGMLYQAQMSEGVVKIPLEACCFHRNKGGEMRGMISITATCDVGRAHMPESTALLIFWM